MAYSLTYTVIPRDEFIPEWADPEDDVFQPTTVATTLIPFSGEQSFFQAILPLASLAPDPAELRTAPTFKYSLKLRTGIPAHRVSLSFIVGRISVQEGGLLALPPVDSGVCRTSSEGLPLRSRHNVWMKREYMPVSVTPVSAQAADIASAGKIQMAFLANLPESLRGSYRHEEVIGGVASTPISVLTTFVLSTLPVLLEEWWFFDGLVNTTSTLSVTTFDRNASIPPAGTIPFPDKDPGVQLRAAPDEELMIYSFVWWPLHTPDKAFATPSMVYSPDAYTTTGRAMGFMQSTPLVGVCH